MVDNFFGFKECKKKIENLKHIEWYIAKVRAVKAKSAQLKMLPRMTDDFIGEIFEAKYENCTLMLVFGVFYGTNKWENWGKTV